MNEEIPIGLGLHKAMDAAVGVTPDDISSEWELEPGLICDVDGPGTALGARRELRDHLWKDVGGPQGSGDRWPR